jgi:hypothetical protein
MRKFFGILGAIFAIVGLLCLSAQPAPAQDQSDQNKAPAYTMPEYNGFQACHAETNAQMRVKCLDDFVAKFPNSTLMPYVLQLYVASYNELKNYPKTIEYADKLVALGDKVDAGTKLQALYTRSLAFNYAFSDKPPTRINSIRRAQRLWKDSRPSTASPNQPISPTTNSPSRRRDQRLCLTTRRDRRPSR